jgi:hypothetical protein
MEQFWMVWNPAGRAPTVKHDTEKSARAEAERLAKANPGQTFVVLRAIGACETVKPVTWTPITSPQGHVDGCLCDVCIPF